jgi:hypothetical protein
MRELKKKKGSNKKRWMCDAITYKKWKRKDWDSMNKKKLCNE